MKRLILFGLVIGVSIALAGPRPTPARAVRFWDGGAAARMVVLADGGAEAQLAGGGTLPVRVVRAADGGDEY